MRTSKAAIAALPLALAALLLQAPTALAGSTATLKGTRNGTLVSQTDTPLVYGASNAATVVFKPQLGGTAAKVTLTGKNVDGSDFTAVVTFKADGTAHTNAIVPGVANYGGDGTWSINDSGRVLTYDLHSSEPVVIKILSFATGAITTHGKIKLVGPMSKFRIKGTASGTSNFGPVTGHYKFH